MRETSCKSDNTRRNRLKNVPITGQVEREEITDFRGSEMGLDEVGEEVCVFIVFDVTFSECSEELCPALLQIVEELMWSEGRRGSRRMR